MVDGAKGVSGSKMHPRMPTAFEARTMLTARKLDARPCRACGSKQPDSRAVIEH